MKRLHLLDVFDMALAVALGIVLAGYFFGSVGVEFSMVLKLLCVILLVSASRWILSPKTHDIMGPDKYS